jgi:hypothetical protein
MSKLHHVVTDLHQVYLTEMEVKIKPQMGKKEGSSSSTAADAGGGGSDEQIKKQARQLAYDTRYKARREDIPLERAWSQVLQNSSASAPVKELAKSMVFKEEHNLGEEDKKKEMVLVTPVKGFGKPYRRYASLKKKHELRSNPQIQSVVGTSYGKPYEGERTKGETTAKVTSGKKDQDGDGDNDFADVMSARMQASGVSKKAANKKVEKKPYNKKPVKEGYSSWRDDLREVMDILDKEKNDKKISEKKVNNKIVINPPLKEAMSSFGAEIVQIEEISEDYLVETVDIATEYFFNNGLNEYGVDIVIEELGLEKFTDFVFYVAEDYELTEARRSGRIEPVTKGGKSVASLKGGAKTAAINRLRKEKQAARSGEGSGSGSSKMTAALKSQSSVAKKVTTDKGKKAVEKAKETQGSKKPLKDRIAKGVLGAVKAYQQGMERHKAATATAGKALKVAAKGASEFGKGVASGVKATGKAAKDVHKVLKNSYEMGEAVYGGELKKPAAPADTRMTVTAADKKANTKAWQKYKAGHPSYKAADHLQNEAKKMKGEDPCWKGYEMVGTKKKGGKEVPNCVPKEAVNPYAVGMAAAMKATGDNPPLKKSTINKAHKIAKKVEAKEEFEIDEAISTVTGQQGNQVPGKQQDTEQKQTKNAQAKLNKILSARKNLQMAQQQAVRSGVTNIASSFEPDGEIVDERTRYAKETGMSATRKGRKSEKGGAQDDKAYTMVKRSIRKMEGTPAGQRKKEPGKKPPTAGQYGGPASPAQKVAKRRADAQRARDNMSSRFD